MNRQSQFSYDCNACGKCCRDKVITLAPYDLLRIARAAGVSTREAIARFTLRRGSILKFGAGSACSMLDGVRCGIHDGRPLACRLYPLGLERAADRRGERFVRLEPAPGSRGVYGDDGTVWDFLEAQDVVEYLEANDRYRRLIARIRARIAELVDFEKTEPHEFWRVATREALAESDYDPNPLIDAMFDLDGLVGRRDDEEAEMFVHLAALAVRVGKITDAAMLAAASVMLAVSLGYSPAEAIES
ncbi:MAG: YkgJ family cysteine cluster protein [Candidatus Binataceae bacterium]